MKPKLNQETLVAFLLLVSSFAKAEIASSRFSADLRTTHYTSCLLNVRQEQDEKESQLPSWALEDDPIILTDKDGKDFYVMVFGAFSATNPDMPDMESSEVCTAFLAHNSHPQIHAAFPELPYLQSSKCYGLNVPGYEAAKVHVQAQHSATFGSSLRLSMNDTYLYSQTHLPYSLIDLSSAFNDVTLETFHTHHARTSSAAGIFSPTYGYIMRAYVKQPSAATVDPVILNMNQEAYKNYFGIHLEPTDLHSCISVENFEIAGLTPFYGTTVAASYDIDASPSEFYNAMDPATAREHLDMNTQPLGSIILENEIYDAFDKYLNPLPAAGFEFDFMPIFRTITTIMNGFYLFFAAGQRLVNGSYPGVRYREGSFLAKAYIGSHIFIGMIVIYFGCFLHIQNELHEVSKARDEAFDRQLMYKIYGVLGLIQGISVYGLLSKVMGEKRLTIPMYFGAGTLNIYNSIELLLNPNLRNAFLLFGSVSTFVYVRVNILLLNFAHIDWELMYTYAITVAAMMTWFLTAQTVYSLYILILIILYAPFHEWVCKNLPWLHFTNEDVLDGNKPTKKNIIDLTVQLRGRVVKDYKDKVDRERNQSKVGFRRSSIFARSKRWSSLLSVMDGPEATAEFRGVDTSELRKIDEEEANENRDDPMRQILDDEEEEMVPPCDEAERFEEDCCQHVEEEEDDIQEDNKETIGEGTKTTSLREEMTSEDSSEEQEK